MNMHRSGVCCNLKSMKKQTAIDRFKRLSRGCCPVHGIFMPQVGLGCTEKDSGSYTIVGCPRKSCMIIARTYSCDGPWELPENLLSLLDDLLPDPVFIDEKIK